MTDGGWYDGPLDDEYKGLVEQNEQDIDTWMPREDGSSHTVVGEVIDITDATSTYGEYPLLTLRQPSGKLIAIHCFHKVLRNEVERKMSRKLLVIGTKVAITYKGEGAAKGGNEAPQMYRVSVAPPQ